MLTVIGIALLCCAAVNPLAAAQKPKPYALIYGTVYGPDDTPVTGVHVRIRKKDDKKPRYEQYSDRRGEFAQRVPVGPADYIVYADLKSGQICRGDKCVDAKKSGLKPGKEATVHFDGEERQDISLHLTQ